MLTREEVLVAYRLILGREPENEFVITNHMEHARDLLHLRLTLLNSPEFRLEFSSSLGKPFEPSGPLEVDVDCSSAELDSLFSRIQQEWKALGESEPMWSVSTKDKFKSHAFPQHANEFHNSGRSDVTRYLTWLERHDLSYKTFRTCLEFGCGVGRATRWLAAIHPEVVACDISQPHLKLAEEYLLKEGLVNTRFVLLENLRQLELLAPFDVFFSILVLQHNPPPLIAYVLRTIFRLLRSGGVAYFQVPTYWNSYSFNVEKYLSAQECTRDGFEMHILPQQYVFELAEENGCSLLEIHADGYTEIPASISNTFLLIKR